MSTKSTLRVLTALSVVVAKSAALVAVPASAGGYSPCEDYYSTGSADALLQCCSQHSDSDRAALQAELDRLLATSPDDPCVSYIVGLLGTPPVAFNSGGGGGGGDDGDRRGNIDLTPEGITPVGVTTVAY